MSFKREGDDTSQLNILKKRRVADLLSHFIPEDEATLLKNGRYTCLVCSFRPVFDTVDVLTVHRKGKRHLEALKSFYGKKARLKNEVTKRHHEIYVQAEDQRQEPSSSAPLLAQTRRLTRHALLKTAPYNSCHRTTSTKSEKGRESIKTASEAEEEPEGSGSQRGSSEFSTADEEQTKVPVAAVKQDESLTAERRSELEHYLKLKSDGWLRDRSGQWVKDENVEFDSDDEEPPSLPARPSNQ